MEPATHIENGEWFSRRATIASAVAAWVGGFVLAGLASWHAQHSRGTPPATDEMFVTTAAPLDVVPTDTTSAEPTLQVGTVVFLPEDVIISSPRARRLGVAERQKP